jgi:hypothetical protein
VTNANVSKLTVRQANEAAQYAVQQWAKQQGLEAVEIWRRIEEARQGVDICPWALSPSLDDERAAPASRGILRVFLASEDSEPELARWAREGIDKASKARAHVAEPVSTTVFLLIGLVIAARISSIDVSKGKAVFYQGIPTGLEKVIKAAADLIRGASASTREQ